MAFNESEVAFPDHHGTAVLQFASDAWRALATEHMRTQEIRVLVEADDNYLMHPGKSVLERSGWGMKIGERPFTREGHRLIASRADGVITATSYLADRYREVNPHVYVCPNGVDPADWPEPEETDEVLRIVWAASFGHEADAGLVRRAMEWASRQPGVQVFTIGLDPVQHVRPKHRWRFRHGHVPMIPDLDAYRDSLRHFDIGIAPIVPSAHGLGRSDLKALEYAMGLVCPVLSDVRPYEAWTDGENCLKARDEHEWLRVIKHLVAYPDEAKQLARSARAYTLAERTHTAQVHLWQEAIA